MYHTISETTIHFFLPPCRPIILYNRVISSTIFNDPWYFILDLTICLNEGVSILPYVLIVLSIENGSCFQKFWARISWLLWTATFIYQFCEIPSTNTDSVQVFCLIFLKGNLDKDLCYKPRSIYISHFWMNFFSWGRNKNKFK